MIYYKQYTQFNSSGAMAGKDGAGSNNDRSIEKAFKEARDIAEKQPSRQRQLREVRNGLDPSHDAAVQKFYDHMPEAVLKFTEWKKEAARLIEATSVMGFTLTLAFTGEEYTDEDVYDDFTSDTFTNEIQQLKGDIAHNKVIDGMKLAQDAARNFAWWQQFHGDISTASTVAATLSGLGTFVYAITAQGLRTLAISAGPVAAVSVVTLQLLFSGWDRASRNRKGKKNLTEKAVEVSDITESIERDVQLLDKIGVYVDEIIKCQQKVKNIKRINKLQKDKVVIFAKKITEACDQYNEAE